MDVRVLLSTEGTFLVGLVNCINPHSVLMLDHLIANAIYCILIQ